MIEAVWAWYDVSETIGVPPFLARMSLAVTRRVMISADKARFPASGRDERSSIFSEI
jgi:hypothetical protein